MTDEITANVSIEEKSDGDVLDANGNGHEDRDDQKVNQVPTNYGIQLNVEEKPKDKKKETDETEAAPYIPLPTKRKRKRNKPKPPLGVAGLLDYARIKFSTEQGDYDVEEDEEGAISIGGQELSFETWGQLTRTQEDGVCKADVVLPRQKKRKPKLIYDVASTSNGKSSAKKRQQKGEDKDDKIDKDEGELSDSEDSDSSTSSEDSDEGNYRKVNKKRKTATNNMDARAIFTKGYQYRNLLVQNLNLQQKMAFFELLRQQLSTA